PPRRRGNGDRHFDDTRAAGRRARRLARRDARLEARERTAADVIDEGVGARQAIAGETHGYLHATRSSTRQRRKRCRSPLSMAARTSKMRAPSTKRISGPTLARWRIQISWLTR